MKQTRGFVLSMSLSTTSARTWGPRALSRVAPRLMHHCVCDYLQANLLDERASWKGRQGALDGNQVVNSDPPDPRVKGGRARQLPSCFCDSRNAGPAEDAQVFRLRRLSLSLSKVSSSPL